MTKRQRILEANEQVGLDSTILQPTSTNFNEDAESNSSSLVEVAFSTRSPINKLPAELVRRVCDFLTNKDIKSLRLTCKRFSLDSELRIDRVFISADAKVLEIFQGIANTPRLAYNVREIVLDDSTMHRYDGYSPGEWYVDYIRDSFTHMEQLYTNYEDYANCFLTVYGRTPAPCQFPADIQDRHRNWYTRKEIEQPVQPPAEQRASIEQAQRESFVLYQKMYREHNDIVLMRADLLALKQSLRSFPKLQSVKLHQNLWNVKLTESPLRRLHPPSLFWPGRKERREVIHEYFIYKKRPERPLWRVVDSILTELALCSETRVSQLSTSVGYEHFDGWSKTARAWSKMCDLDIELDLDLQTLGIRNQQYGQFCNHHLRFALAGARKLERLRLVNNAWLYGNNCGSPWCRRRTRCWGFQFSAAMPKQVMNGQCWPNLRELELVNMQASSRDLIDLFLLVRPSIKSIILRQVELLRPSTYMEFIDKLRVDLQFRADNPKLIISLSVRTGHKDAVMNIQLDKHLCEFFEGGLNPFQPVVGRDHFVNYGWLESNHGDKWGNQISKGFGTITSF